MDILDIKRGFSNLKENIDNIRGSLWIRKKRGKNKKNRRDVNNWRFLEW